MTNLLDEDDWTEASEANIPRVDLVGRAANGVPGFLVMKQDEGAGLLDAGFVRDLIAKAEPEPREETLTMTGSPGAIAKMIHEVAVLKAKYDAADLARMAANGQAMANESYPIADRDDLDRAIRAVGRGGASHDAIRRHVITRAKALGAQSEIPDNWAADGSLKEVTKMAVTGELDDGIDGMDPTVVLAEPDGDMDAPGDMNEPGSPAWEAIDAATARKWTSIAVRLRNALCVMAEREMLEAASADPDDIESAWDLKDAECALDYVIDTLAGFAVEEQAEAELCGEAMEAVGKALAGFDTTPLDTFEALAPIAKAGRVLSAGNEAAIRGAVDSLQKVLASLPQAPTTEEAGAPVAKTANEEADMAEPTPSADVTAASGQEPAMGAQQADPKPVAGQVVTDMAKADGDKPQMVAVYDKKGNLVGIVDPTDITTIAGAESDDEDGAPASGPADDGEAAAPETTDLTPAPAAEAGTPADAVPDDADVTKSTADTTLTDVFKSSILAAVESAFTEHSASQNTVLAKQGEAVLELADLVKELKGRIGALEEQPAEPRVFTNGAVPPRDLRGMDRGAAAQVDVAKAREQKGRLYKAANATEQNRIAQDMQADAIAALRAIHQGGARQ